nr:BTAD domain-containing putative transcriptional regulator [Ahniella affigens]
MATLFHYLAQASGSRKRGPALPRFGNEHRPDTMGFARLFFRSLFAQWKTPALLVFDNYHELPADADWHRLWELIVSEAPTGLALMVTSRQDPPAECARLLANEQMHVLGWDTLRLNLAETREIAALRQLTDEPSIRVAFDQSGGWPVALTLNIEHRRRVAQGLNADAIENREWLFDYFAAQIFASIEPEAHVPLMRAALLPNVTAADASAMAAGAAVWPLLERLYKKRMFVERRGDIYQFHDLFRAFLVREFERRQDAQGVANARTQAAVCLMARELPEPAFELAVAANNWPLTAEIVNRFAPLMFEQGRNASLLAWITQLPEALVRGSSWLSLWYGVALAPGSPMQARAQFEHSHELFGEDDRIGKILSCSAVLATHYLEFDHGQVDRWLDRLLPLLDDDPALPAPAAALRVYGAVLFALSYQRPLAALIDPVIAKIQVLLADSGASPNAKVDAATLVLAHLQIAAQFVEADRLIAIVQPWLSDPVLTPNYRALWTLQEAHCRVRQGRDRDAEILYERAQGIAHEHALQLPLLRIYSRFGRAILALCERDADRARIECDAASAHSSLTRRLDRALDLGLRAGIASHLGEPAEAVQRARQQIDLLDQAGPLWLRSQARLLLALYAVDAGDTAIVHHCIDAADQLLVGTCLNHLASASAVVRVYAQVRTDPAKSVHRDLQACVANLEGLYFLRQHPSALAVVLGEALRQSPDSGDLRRAVRNFGLAPPEVDAPGWPWAFAVRMLGRFELLRDGKPLEYSRKLPRKTLALLKAIIALGGTSVSEQRLLDALWPDDDGDVAARAMDATVIRLRVLLGDPAALQQRGGRLSLQPGRWWVDVFAFEQALVKADEAAQRRDVSEAAHLARAQNLYRGAFLEEEDGESWPVATRERLRSRFLHALARHAQQLEAGQQDDAAITLYLKGLDADPAIESFYQGLMRCYQRLGRRSEGIAAYQRLRQVLLATIGLPPAAATERLLQLLRQ